MFERSTEFVWGDRSHLQYSNWLPGEPNNLDEGCILNNFRLTWKQTFAKIEVSESQRRPHLVESGYMVREEMAIVGRDLLRDCATSNFAKICFQL